MYGYPVFVTQTKRTSHGIIYAGSTFPSKRRSKNGESQDNKNCDSQCSQVLCYHSFLYDRYIMFMSVRIFPCAKGNYSVQ